MNVANCYYDGNKDEVRFAEPTEILNKTTHIVYGEEKTNGSGIVVKSDGKEAYVDDNDVRTLIIADSGAGKTRRCVIPMIISMILNGVSIVVNDPKGEIYKWVSKLLTKSEFEVHMLNFRNPMNGDRYNLLSLGAKLYKNGDKSRASEYFYAFFYNLYEPQRSEKDPFWTNESENYATGLCLLSCEIMELEDITIENIYNLHLFAQKKVGGKLLIEQSFDEEMKSSGAYKLMEGTLNAPNDTKSSINSVMTQVLSRLVVNENIVDMLSASDFDVENIGKKKTAIFLITKDESTVYNSIVASFIEQTYLTLVDMAEAEFNGFLPIRVEFVMDEFGNMTKLNDINQKITASRSRNIRWHLVVQGLEQLSMVYGKEVASILLGNCDDWLYLHSNDIALLEQISYRCGEYSTEYTKEKRKLLSVSRLQHFNKEKGECLILMGRQYPYITYLPDISKYDYEPLESMPIEKRKCSKKSIFDIEKLSEKNLKEKKEQEIITKQKKMKEKLDKIKQQENNAIKEELNNEFKNLEVDLFSKIFEEELES